VKPDRECPHDTYTGQDPVSFVISLNLKRRHLDESQRSAVAAKPANMKVGGKEANSANLPDCSQISQADAANMLNVSERSVRSAAKVLDHGTPELQKAVEQGKASVSPRPPPCLG
jgi:hypothetical protein